MSPSVSEDDWRAIDKLISTDPNLPSVAYQAHENVPICFPWARKPVVVGMGFDSEVASKHNANEDHFRAFAFARAPGKAEYLFEPTENCSMFRQNASTHAASFYEHMNFKGSFSAGNSVLGVSGRGEFNENVSNNRDSSKVSLQASLRVGRITQSALSLSSHAMNLLRTSPTDFHRTYGDYFLYALIIGADTSTFLSTSSSMDLRSKMRDIQVEATVFGTSETVYADHRTSQYASEPCEVTFNGFDTLSGRHWAEHTTDQAAYEEVKTAATKNVAGGMNLDKRAKAVLARFGLDLGNEERLSEEQCKALCESGLVVEMMLLPYSGLRDYVASTSKSIASRLE